MRRVDWQYRQQNVSLQKWRLDPALNHFYVMEERLSEANICVKNYWERDQNKGANVLLLITAPCRIYRQPMLVWLLQYNDAAVNWSLGLQLAPGQQRWAKGKWALATDGSREPNLFPIQDGANALTLPEEVLGSQLWRRESHFFSSTAKTRQRKM